MNSNSSDSLTRRRFVKGSAALAATTIATGNPSGKSAETADPHPFLTPAEDFYNVARGTPKPHTLTGQALINARMTPETWRLEITADPFTEPPDIKEAAKVEKPLTMADGNALDLPALRELGNKHGVKFIKAMQCLNIAEPLGQGLWEGVPLSVVLRLCGKIEHVRRIYYRGFHNNDPKQIFQSSVSYTQAMETPPGELPVFLAYRLNGEALQPLRGGPVRMVVPWAHGFKSIKWLQQIFLTNDYRTSDTYALRNNDPESYLKTAAYVDDGPDEIPAGDPVTVTGQVISGLSGLSRVEYWVRKVDANSRKLADDDPELLKAPWKPCDLALPPDWQTVLPFGVSTRDLLGFDNKTGEPNSWPPRFGMASWSVTLRDLKPGTYEIRARSVDLNGFAQPEPRPMRKAGKNEIQKRKVTLL